MKLTQSPIHYLPGACAGGSESGPAFNRISSCFPFSHLHALPIWVEIKNLRIIHLFAVLIAAP